MLLQGKKIGFALSVSQLGDKRILKEIEKILFQGAELFIVLLGNNEKKNEESIKRKLQNIFRHLSRGLFKKSENDDKPTFLAEHKGEKLDYPFLDLLILAPNSERFLGFLEQITPEDRNNLPLVLAPILENEPTTSLSYISSLMTKKGIFFVPFGPVPQKMEKKSKSPSLYSRLDLLTETCAAALEGQHLKPPVWDTHTFPH